ncbi:MAG: GNAT family N-acetyltransferase [Betaproteobacteria bacterium]|nr:GNAT family N-acetyltransferase [Betaproteobacteria bacterium]
MTIPYRILVADWSADRDKLRALRETVFVQEQKVPVELEWDEEDARCIHVMAETQDGKVIGTGRLLQDGHIGRMAVLQAWRRSGVGSALIVRLMELAKQAGHAVARLHAQSYVAEFYRRHGFAAEGEEFMEAGIAHSYMSRVL